MTTTDVRMCPCGNEIPPTGKRGRPATRCTSCRVTKIVTSVGDMPTVEVTCKCGTVFSRPVRRGRPQTRCETCRDSATATAETTETVSVIVPTLTFGIDPSEVCKGSRVTAEGEDGTFTVMTGELARDGSVRLYGGSKGYEMHRSIMPNRLRFV